MTVCLFMVKRESISSKSKSFQEREGNSNGELEYRFIKGLLRKLLGCCV